MNKGVVIAGAVGLGALLFYLWERKSAGPETPLGIPAPNLPGAAARVDNQSQPWYNNASQAVNAKVAGYINNPSQVLQDVSSVVHSMADIWGSVSGLFGGGEDAANVDENIFYSDDPTAGGAYTEDMAAAFADQSDAWSDAWMDQDFAFADFDVMGGGDVSWEFEEGSSDDWYNGYGEIA